MTATLDRAEIEAHRFTGPLNQAAPPPSKEVLDYGAGQGKVWYRGGWTCTCVTSPFDLIEQDMLLHDLIRFNIDIFQWGWRTDVSASAGTHAKGGVFDTGQFSDAHLAVWRDWGFEAQHRTTAQGFSVAHGHVVAKGCPHRSGAADYQANVWERGLDGLVSAGRITGPGPIGTATPTWMTGLTERKAELMALKDEFAAAAASATVAQLRGQFGAIADAVLLHRDVIPNTIASQAKKNPDLTLAGLLGMVLWRVDDAHNDTRGLQGRLDKLEAEIAALRKAQ